ncbi:hypothetical protein ACJMK2_038101 [Sinanodonta woodiana]|uniref:Alpha-mannosidase n=1 Tax=Sinanodonta woodiana TaxID=1069815 RepID=A0ABD3WR40_SINWO
MKRKHLLQTFLVIVCFYLATNIWIHLHLHIVPKNLVIHAHEEREVCWTMTYDQYYYEKTHNTLSLMVEKLAANPHWKFIWELVTYLDKWWLTASQTERQTFKRLIESGQLEIPTGGWVMTDEGTAHYTAMLDQLMEGHQWLSKNLFIDVQTSWSIDPFGHSSTMTYLLHESGIKHMVIQRVHFAVKRHLSHLKSLEFFWHQGWKGNGHKDIIFCHMMPFLSYGIPFSCGPDEHVCCQFDFYKKKCRRGTKLIDAVTVNEKNLETLSWQLWEQLQKKSELYRSNVLLVPHGDDFRFLDAAEWDAQFQNLEKIMGYINNNRNMKTKIQFGTLKDYFQALQGSSRGPRYQHYPSFSGDFFPYTDRDDQYWSGLYTSRPFHKRIARYLQALLRSAEIWFSLIIARGLVQGKTGYPSSSDILTRLSSVRHSLALHQHHDAITGTSKATVMKDYGERLHTAVMEASNVITEVLRTVIVLPNQDMEPNIILHMAENMKTDTSLPDLETIDINEDRLILVSNSLGQSRHEVISIHVNRLDIEVILTKSSKPVQFQVGPVYKQGHMISDKKYKLSFEADLPGLSAILFTVRISKEKWKQSKATIKVFNHTEEYFTEEKLFQSPFSVMRSELDHFYLENSFITATFHTCNGKLQHVYSKLYGKGHQAEINFVTYVTGSRSHPFRDKSGAYIFLPDGPAKILPAHYLFTIVIEGPLLSEVWTEQQDILHKVTIYNTTGPNELGIHIENIVSLDDKWNNTELIMRIESDIKPHPHTMCTDVNGFQLHRRKTRQKLTIQGNFYPMTTMALVEDAQSRLSLLTRESHGVASLVPGWLEVVLDRRLVQDDWRGLGEGLYDNLPTRSHFVLHLEERKRSTVRLTSHLCRPSLQASQMSQLIENLPIVTSIHTTHKGDNLLNMLQDYRPQIKAFPCEIHLVNLKTLFCNESSAESLMVLHRFGIDCDFPMLHTNCHSKGTFDLSHLTNVQVSDVMEMYLTGVKVKQKVGLNTPLDVGPMELKTYKLLFSGN